MHDILHQYGRNILIDFEKHALFRLRSLLPPATLPVPRQTHIEKNHKWHLDLINKLANADSQLIKKTEARIVDIDNESSRLEAITWWDMLTKDGGEGIVVKPFDFTSFFQNGLIQPGLKCRGREYLRIIYGPEYTVPENLNRLKIRNVSHKRSVALREYALGVEALERFVKKEPVYRYHEVVFSILALESEPVDPRL